MNVRHRIPARPARRATGLARSSPSLAALALSPLAGCCLFEIESLNGAYEDEYVQEMRAYELGGAQPPPMVFRETLERIRDFTCPEDRHAQHVDVIKAMVHLHAYDFGRARAAIQVRESWADAEAGASTSRRRNRFLFEALTAMREETRAGLIEAWVECSLRPPHQDGERLRAIADTLVAVVERAELSSEDFGLVFVAGTAANCYFHAAQLAQDTFPETPPEFRPIYQKVVATLAPFLDEEEKTGQVEPSSPNRFFADLYERARQAGQ